MSMEIQEKKIVTDEKDNVDGFSPKEKTILSSKSEPKVVTLERKEELLLEARRARVAWVDASSYPYNTAAICKNGDEDDGYKLLESTRVGQSMKKSIIPILKELYSSTEADSNLYPTDRIRKQFDSLITAGDFGKVLGSYSYPSKTQNTITENRSHETEAVRYELFLQKLRSPECAELVQTMRHFVQTFVDTIQKALEEAKGNEDVHLIRTNIATAIQTYLSKLQQNESIVFLKNENTIEKEGDDDDNDDDDGDNDHREIMTIMEIFVYSKCHEAIMSVLLADEELKMQETQLNDKLTALQFITPKHLELDYLEPENKNSNSTTTKENNGDDWRNLLASPCQTLKKMNDLVSPGQMLECVLEVYRGINESLQSAKTEDEVAGADDVLPAWILTVLSCSSTPGNNMCTQLQFIESFATPEQLRGEAGYAYTNYYGAVQFLKDLEEKNASSFSKMTPEEFKQGLQNCRDKAQQRISTTSSISPVKRNAEVLDVKQQFNASSLQLSAKDVRAARLAGENLDVQWAFRWYDKCRNESEDEDESHLHETKIKTITSRPPPPLPEGFRRKYNFLSCTPKDVRLNDVPMLLEEYQMLVRATESLLAERSAWIQEEQQSSNIR